LSASVRRTAASIFAASGVTNFSSGGLYGTGVSARATRLIGALSGQKPGSATRPAGTWYRNAALDPARIYSTEREYIDLFISLLIFMK
jgi:hypothetical protein